MDMRAPQGPLSLPPDAAPRVRLAGERFLYAWLLVLGGVTVPVALISQWMASGALNPWLVGFCGALLGALVTSYRLVIAGRSRAAAAVLPVVCWGSVTGYAFATGYGLYSATVYFYVPGILYASLLLGIRPAIVLGVLTLVALFLMFLAHDAGLLAGASAVAAETRPILYFIGVASAGAAAVVLALAYRMSVDAALRALDASHRELESAHADVAAMNVSLEKRVATRTRELEETIRELEAFNYSVAHDLRAPLRSINAAAHDVRRAEGLAIPEECLRQLDRIAAETQRMDALLSALLDVGHIGRRPLAVTRIDITGTALRVIERLRQQRSAPDVHVDVEPGLAAEGDPPLVEALLQSLLDNALKFSRYAPAPHVEVGKRQAIAVGTRLTERGEAFFVRDNGVGFDPAHSILLFRPFHRLHNDERFEGIGAGLASARRIVERHGGEIWAESRPGEGATFYFTLPPPRTAEPAR